MNPSTPWINLIFDDFWGTPLTHSGSHKSYRPLCVLSFRFNHWLHELEPAGYHLVNVLLHCASTALFTLMTRSLLPARAKLGTAVAGALFACHPVHTEAVAGIVGRADMGAAIFFILAFLSYRRYTLLRFNLLQLEQRQRQQLASASCSKSQNHLAHHKNSNNNGPSSSSSSSFLATATCTLAKWSGNDTSLNSSKSSPVVFSSLPVISHSGRWFFFSAVLLSPNHSLALRKWLWLLSTLLFAACSMLTKEHGVTVLAVCAIYDLLVHSRLKPRDIFSSALFQVTYLGTKRKNTHTHTK